MGAHPVSLVGRIGEVVTRIRGGDTPGEVSLVVAGSRELYTAFAVDELPIGTSVLVINNRGLRELDVEPWSFPGFGAVGASGP
jgi:hypothetical protein